MYNYYAYTYDATGQRISKTVNGTTTEFYYDDRGALVLMSRDDGTEIYFYPDADGSIGSINYNGNRYYYVRNAQNDIIGITDKTGAFVARYTYDEWGNITSITDGNGNDVSGNLNHIANLNPFRYRSYFYDAETGWYWLNTRYYDPAIGRFINADGAIGQIGKVQGANMFAYCFNNPINMDDQNGNWPKLSAIFKAVAVVATVVAVAAVCVAVASVATVAVVGGGTVLAATATTTAALSVAATAGKVAAVSTAAAAVSDVVENNLPRNHTVYGLQNTTTGEIEYVGRTTNPEKRADAHKRNPFRKELEMVTLAENLSAIEARGVEQILMLEHHTINTANKMNNQINGISPFNSNLEIYMEAGRGVLSYLGNRISNEILYWTGN